MKKLHNISNRTIALLVAISVILSSVAISFPFVVSATSDSEAVSSIWSGDIADNYAGGSGTADYPYLIENGEQLAKLVKDPDTAGKYYKLTQDIYLNDISADNWKDTAKQWFGYNRAAEFPGYFSGTLDGDNRKIVGLYYNGSHYYFGLFVGVKNAVIKNITVSQSSITSSDTSGSVAVFTGYVGAPVNYSKCVIEDTVSINGAHASGFASYGSGNVTIDSCANFANVSGSKYTTSFIADIWSSTLSISNSIGIAHLSPKRSITSVNNYSTVADNYGTGVVTEAQMKGSNAKEKMPNLNWQRVWETTDDGYPKIKVITSDSKPGEIWTGRIATNYAGGDGSEENPCLISNGEQLALLNFDSDTEGKFYKLTHDIILNDSSLSNWKTYAINWVSDTANTTFKGTLLGDGHTVKGLYYKGSVDRAALIKNTGSNVKISRLILDGVHIETSGYGAGAFVGNADGKVKFVECYVKNSSVTSTFNTNGNKGAGGFVGYGTAAVEIEDSAYLGTVSAPDFAGAFIGNCWTAGVHSVKNSFTNANILFCTKRYINSNSANNYGIVGHASQPGVTVVTDAQMKGTTAREYMTNLDWGRTWKIDTNGGYPLPVFPSPDGTVGEIWTGNTATKYADGDGSEENPYLIATGEQLLRLVNDTETEGKFYKIIEDIKLNDTSIDNWKNYARQWLRVDVVFKGTLDGDGHTISGLYYNGSNNRVGLFSFANGATVKRLVIKNSSVTTSDYGASILVGHASGNIRIVEVYIDETNEVKSTYSSSSDNNEGAGGFVGYGGGKVTVEDSAYLGTVEGTVNYGSMLGNLWTTPLIKNSFAKAELKLSGRWALSTDSANNYGGGTVAENGVTLITADKMTGEAAKTNMIGLDWGRTWKVNDSGYPLPIFPDPNGVAGEVWTGNTAVKFNGGDGSEANPYQIATGEQLLKMVLDTESDGKYYKLTHDIKLNDTSLDNWKDEARNWLWNNNIFKGNFNGNGHTISGLYYKGAKSKVGLFCYAADAVIENVVVEDSYIYTTGYAAGTLVGDANSGSVKIYECYVENGYVESTFDEDSNVGAGGLVGYGGAAIEVEGCAYLGEVVAPSNVGAILGNCWCTSLNDKNQSVSELVIKNSFSNSGVRFCSKQTLNNKSDNNYSTYAEAESYVISIAEEQMKGTAAMNNMAGLDWKKLWKTSDNFPVCRFEDVDSGEADIWAGNIAEAYASGTGTKEDPYIIKNGEQLAKMVTDSESKGKFYKLANDIRLNDTTIENWIYGANQWVWTSNIFAGTFDGDGYTIEGLYYNGAKSKVGLFSYAANAVIKNVKLNNSYVKSVGFAVGTVVGDANSGTVDLYKCYVNNGYVESAFDADGNRGAGGLVGYGGAVVTVDASAFIGTVKAPSNAGAILGNCWNFIINEKGQNVPQNVVTNTFSNAGIRFCSKQGLNSKSDFNYSTYEGKEDYVISVAEDKMKGSSVKDNMGALDWKLLWNTGDSFPVCNFEESDAGNTWSDDIAEAYASGTGTKEDPYIIKNGGQLAKMVTDTESKGKFYKLANDIQLNDTSKTDWKYGAKQWIWSNNNFAGNLNGDGYAIEGLFYNGAKSKVGLFCYVTDATVKRLVIRNSSITTSGYAASLLIGQASGNVKFTEVYADETNAVKSTYDYDEQRSAGGFVAYGGAAVTIEDSAYLGAVEGTEKYGAFLGDLWSMPLIKNSFATAKIRLSARWALSEDSENNYGAGSTEENGVTLIKASKMKGKSAKSNMPNLDWGRTWVVNADGYPLPIFPDPNGIIGEVWTGNIAEEFNGGDGTKQNPYLIATGEQLVKMALDTESEGKYYKQICDIKLNDTSKLTWKKSARNWNWNKNIFKGSFDGDGYAIEGLYYKGTKSKVGLFCYAADAVIENVHIIDSYIYTTGYAAGTLVGDANSGNINISKCYVENAKVESTFDADSNAGAGGLVGYGGAQVTVKGSAFIGAVKAPSNAGAILGNCWAKNENGGSALTISNSFSTAGIKLCSKQGLNNKSDNNYSTCKTEESYVIYIAKSKMNGKKAIEKMSALDWKNVWKTTSDFPICIFGKNMDITSDLWSGEIASDYASGTGTEDDPYIIKTGEQLAKMVTDTESQGKFYKLAKNIKLNDTSAKNWTYGATQWVWSNNIFEGTFDGDGYAIIGLYYNGTKSKVGLFSYAKNSTVKNVKFTDSYVKSAGFAVGTVIGDANAGTVDLYQCYVENGYTESTYKADGNMGAGGLIGYGGAAIKVEGSAYFGTVKAPANAGAILGNCWAKNETGGSNLTVKQTISNAGIKFCSKQGLSIYSDTNYSTCKSEESYVVYLKDSKMKGKKAMENMPMLNWNRLWKTTSGYPVCRFGEVVAVSKDVWSGEIADSYASGTGAEKDPYIIKTAEQLAKMVTDTESQGKFYKLAKNIKLNDTSAKNWTYGATQWVWSNNIFEGTFDGDGYAIIGLYYNGTKSKVGLFSYTKNSTVKNVKFTDSYVKSTGFAVGTVIGDANAGTVDLYQCYVENGYAESTYEADGNMGAGGLIGYGGAAIKVEGSAYFGTVKAPANAGAILGNCWAKNETGGSNLTVKQTISNAGIKFCSKQGLSIYSDTNYSTCKSEESYVVYLKDSKMKGKKAMENMPMLNWNRLWKTTSGYPVCRFGEVVTVSKDVWSGEIADSYASGTGTEKDPYIIKTAEQLAKMVTDTESQGKFYKLAKNIKLNDTSAKDWTYGATQWIWTNNVFEGTFDGDGYTIEGLYYDGLKSKVGLFSYTKNSTVKNVKFTDSYVKSAGFAVGTVIGDANAGTVDLYQCYVENGYAESTYEADGNMGAGGLIGYGGAAIKVEGSAYFGTVKAPANAGAILGNCWAKNETGGSNLTVKQTISNAGIKFCTKQGLSGQSDVNYSTCKDAESYVTYVSDKNMRGKKAMKNMSGLDWGRLWKTTSEYPECRFGDVVKTPKDVWTGEVADSYAGGDGSEDNPYIIKTAEQLAKMVLDTETEGKYYKLVKDIKLNDTSDEDWKYYAKQWIWTSNVFKGNFDADTHSITGLYYNGTKSKIGLFCYAANATIKRIVLDDAYIYSVGFATGSLVGDANSGTVIISECYVGENVSVESTYDADGNKGAGGLVGYGGAAVKIDGSAYLGTVKAPEFAGALLGNCWTPAVVSNSFATPEMKFCTKRAISSESASNYSTSNEEESGVTSVKISQMKGFAAKENMPLLNWVRSWKTTKDSFPVLNVGEYEGVKGKVWSGRLAKNFASGSGTKKDPYIIETPEQLAKLVANVLDSKGKYYKLAADIYLNDISKENWEENANQWFWVATARNGNFNGHFDGDGHVIYGMYLNLKQANSVVYTGLFPTISDGTVIEKTGLSNCHMKVTTDNVDWQSYVGGFAGLVFFNQSDEETDPDNLPVISQCFGDSKVVLEGRYAGGIVSGGPRPANIYNSYFIGEVIGERVGAIIGNTWTTYEGGTVTQCYSATNAADIFSGGRSGVQNSSSPINYTENYANSSGLGGYLTQLSLLMMRGDAAKKYMTSFDFEKIWYPLENGTPVLRIFGTSDKFSNLSDPEPIQISFVSNGGTECESIFGNPEEKLTLPTPEREGYKFEGWYVYKELDIPYSIDYFPYFDQILYAKWSPLGVVQDFEKYTNSPYDYGDDYEYYRPGTVGYDAKYVRSGMASMHRIGALDSNKDFLVNYEDMLTIGTTYKLKLWITTDTDDTKVDLSIVHEDFPDVFDTDSGVEEIAVLKGMKQGQWQEVEATFTAKSKWLAIRTSGNAGVYFEDIMIIPTDEAGSVVAPAGTTNNIMLFVIIGAAVVILGVGAAVIIILKKKKVK